LFWIVRDGVVSYGSGMRARFLGYGILAWLAGCGVAPGQTNTVTMTVADAVHLALRHNRTIKSAYLDRIVQRFDLRVAKDEFVPNLDLSASADLRDGDTKTSTTNTSTSVSTRRDEEKVNARVTERLPTGADFSFAWDGNWQHTDTDNPDERSDGITLSLTQPLLRGAGWKTATAPVKLAEIRERQHIMNLRNTVMSTITEVIQAYREFVRADRQEEIARLSLERAEETVEVNRDLIKAGRMAELDLVQAQTDVANQRLSYQLAKNNRDNARLRLISILDIGGDMAIDPEAESEPDITPPSYSNALAIAYANRPDYVSALLRIDAARINRGVAGNNRLWDLALKAEYRLNSSDVGTTTDDDEWRAGVALEAPLYGDLTRKQGYISANNEFEQSHLACDELHDNIALEVRDALRNVESRAKEFELARRARILSAQQLDIEKEKLRLGRTSNFRIVTYQNDLSTAENNELNAMVGYLNALTRLDQVLGVTLMTWRIEVE